MTLPTYTQSASQEARIQLAIQALDRNQIYGIRHAASLYDVPWTTLRDQRAGLAYRRDTIPNSIKLTANEEQVVIDHILDLGSRGFSPRYTAVRDMADKLLAARGQSIVGKNWLNNFVKRVPGLKPIFNQKYDY